MQLPINVIYHIIPAGARYARVATMLLLIPALVTQTGCKKFLDIDGPVTSINETNVYENDATAISVLTGIYGNIISNPIFTGSSGISLLSGLSSDELTLYSGVSNPIHIGYYTNELVANANQNFGSELWAPLYSTIFKCNAAIESIGNSESLTPGIKTQLLGEAKFMRAFSYFYLVNFYGDVPLITTTDPAKNAVMGRASAQLVYQRIINDLTEAKEQLSADYLNGDLLPYGSDPERIRPLKWAAAALLARTYLYTGEWAKAEEEATAVISNTGLYEMTALDETFLKNSREAIWQLQPVRTERNTEDAFAFIIPSTGPSDAMFDAGNPVYLSPNLLNDFEANDNRRKNWVDSVEVDGTIYRYPFKYKAQMGSVTEYLMVMRLSEQYLVRAEARAQLNNITGAKADLDVVRNRAGLPNTLANDKEALLAAILHERKVELFTEWAHRWLDLKRTGQIDAVMPVVAPQKGCSWQPTDKLYPLPYTDILTNRNLKQNTGY